MLKMMRAAKIGKNYRAIGKNIRPKILGHQIYGPAGNNGPFIGHAFYGTKQKALGQDEGPPGERYAYSVLRGLYGSFAVSPHAIRVRGVFA